MSTIFLKDFLSRYTYVFLLSKLQMATNIIELQETFKMRECTNQITQRDLRGSDLVMVSILL